MTRIKILAAIILAGFLLLSCGYIHAESCDHDVQLYPIRENGKWGFMNAAGEVVIHPAYDAVSPCINGYIAVSSNNDWGIISGLGESIVPMEYRISWKENCSVMVVKDQADVLALFCTETGALTDFQWQNVRIEPGKRVFPMQSPDGLWGYVNAEGDECIPCRFLKAYPFCEGWAGVEIYKLEHRWYTCDALVNETGELLFPPEGYSIMNWDGVSEGLIQVRDDRSGLIGYMDMRGDIVIASAWEDAHAFHAGFAAVEDFSADEGYYIDRNGKVLDAKIHPPTEGDDANTSFSWGVTTVFVDTAQGSALAVMDDTGNILFTNHHENIAWIFHYFDGDRAWYINNDEFYGLMNKSGQLITDAEYGCLNVNGSPFAEGVAPVAQNGLWGYIDLEGEWAIAPEWDKAQPFCGGLALVEQNNKFMYIDHRGNTKWAER